MQGVAYDSLGGLSLAFLAVLLFYLAKLVNDKLAPYNIGEELRGGNLALIVSLSGYFVGIVIVFLGAITGPSQGIVKDLVAVSGYSILGIFLLNLSRLINDKAILYRFSNVKEIIEDRNVGTGAVQFGSYIASGLVVAGAIHGEGGGLHTAMVFFLLGQAALIIFTRIYNLVTPYDIHDEIEQDNVAAGLALGGTLIALGIILMKGTSGNFISWKFNLATFGLNALAGFIILPFIRLFFDKALIPKTDLNSAIQNDRNVAAGLLEMTVLVCFAVILFFTMDFSVNF